MTFTVKHSNRLIIQIKDVLFAQLFGIILTETKNKLLTL